MPRKLRQLISDLEQAGFVLVSGGKGSQRHPRYKHMKAQDRYLKFVRWEEADGLYVGYCPDLFPWGGACHGATEEAAYRELCGLVEKEVEEVLGSGRELPPVSTRPMREAVMA